MLLFYGEIMRTQWIGKNVDLTLLSERVKSFLSKEEFSKIEIKKTNGNYVISELPTNDRGGWRSQLVVKIKGEPKDFEVEFSFSGRGVASKIAGLATLFGVGGLVLRRIKSEEMLEALERGFWAYMDKTVEEVANSARTRA